MRRTIDIDDPILKEIKLLQQREGKSLGRLVSDLLAQSLADLQRLPKAKATFDWIVQPMDARVDLADKQAVRDEMDGGSK